MYNYLYLIYNKTAIKSCILKKYDIKYVGA